MSNERPYEASGFEVSTWWDYQIYDGVHDVVMQVSHYVSPKIGDFILSRNGNTIIRKEVIAKDGLLAITKRVYGEMEDDGVEDLTVQDLSATTMILIRNKATPILAAVHIGLPIESSEEIGYAKLFVGTDIHNLDAVVSRRLDNDGEPIDDRIKVVKDPINGMKYKAELFNVDRIVQDKTRGTLVFYSVTDQPIAKYTIIFRESDSLVNYSSTELFITDLELESVLLNPLNSRELLVERGFLNSSFNPRVYKKFNTGQREEISLTSRQLKLSGWGNFAIGEENDTFPLTVQYTLASNEKSDMVSSERGAVISSRYTIRVVDDSDSINYKLYPIVSWNSEKNEYQIRFTMYDSTYKTHVDVTDFISLSREFEGRNFSETQVFSYSVELKEAAITPEEQHDYGSFAIRLYDEPMGATTPFSIYMVPSDEVRFYGDSLRTRLTFDLGQHVLSIDSDYTQYKEWLDNVYYKLLPAYDSNTMSMAPEPTHCDVYIGNKYVTLDVLNQWNIGAKWPFDVPTGKHTVELRWYSYDEDNGRNYLAISTMQLEIV